MEKIAQRIKMRRNMIRGKLCCGCAELDGNVKIKITTVKRQMEKYDGLVFRR